VGKERGVTVSPSSWGLWIHQWMRGEGQREELAWGQALLFFYFKHCVPGYKTHTVLSFIPTCGGASQRSLPFHRAARASHPSTPLRLKPNVLGISLKQMRVRCWCVWI